MNRARATKAQIKQALKSYSPASHLIPEWAAKKSRPRKTYKREEENLQKTLVKFLELHPKILFWHTPNNTYVGEKTYKSLGYLDKLKSMGCRKGVPDLILFFTNKYGNPAMCAAEVKSAKGVLTPEQKDFIKKWEDRGGFAAVVRSIEDMQNLLKIAGYGY